MQTIKDKFLTDIIGKPVYNIDFPSDIGYEIITYKSNSLYSVKIDSNELGRVRFLIGQEFLLVGTEVTFKNNKEFINYFEPEHHIEEWSHEFTGNMGVVKVIERFTKEAFTYDRFHRDPNIDNGIADEIKTRWVNNALFRKRGDCIAVAFDCIGNPLGFLIAIEKEDKAIIDLIAVNINTQKQGVGSDLMRWFLRKYFGKQLQVGTQIDNEASIKLYKKFGIDEIVSFKYVLHLHTGG